MNSRNQSIAASASTSAPETRYPGPQTRRPRLRITEIYKSIQGESTFAGLPCIFIRTTGCNLRCVWCDSEYSFYGGQWLTLDAIMAEVEKLDCNLVELTGGEPLLQPAVPTLAKRLQDAGKKVLVETS